MSTIFGSMQRTILRALLANLAFFVFAAAVFGVAKEPSRSVAQRPDKPESQRPFEGSTWRYLATREEKGEKLKKEGAFRLEDKAFTPIRKKVGDMFVDQFDIQVNFAGFPDLKGGRAFIKKETDDYWKGYYLDEKRERWKFELRRGEE